MRLSLNTAYICTIGSMEKTLQAFKDAGFDTFDYSLSYLIEQCDTYIDKKDYIEKTKKLREFADKLGLKCNQSHSFMKYPDKELEPRQNSWRWNMCIRSIQMAAIMGAEYVVVHPFPHYSEDENVYFFKELLEEAKENHIKIAIENVPDGVFSYEESINSMLDKINDPDICLCLDIGHAELPKQHPTSASNIIRKCSKYLKCMHIHDNDKYHDSHTLPGMGLIDFDEVIKALKEVGYNGDLTYEVDGYIYDNFDVENRDKALPIVLKSLKDLYNKLHQ